MKQLLDMLKRFWEMRSECAVCHHPVRRWKLDCWEEHELMARDTCVGAMEE